MWRAYRTLAIHNILLSQREAPGKYRIKQLGLTLTAACVWLANSMHSRPMDDSAYRKLMDLALPREQKEILTLNTIAYPTPLEDPADDETHPCWIYGAIFLRKFYLPGAVTSPRMASFEEGLGFFTPVESKFLFGMTAEDLKYKFNNLGFYRREDVPVARERVTNKKRRTEKFYNWEEDGAALPTLFNLGARGIELPRLVDDASDGGLVDDDDDDDNDGSLDGKLTTLWRQYLQDVIMKIPNPSDSSQSYCRFDEEQRRMNAHRLFGPGQNMAEIFHRCAWKMGTTRTFQTVFNKQFPPKGHIHIEGSGQGFGASTYYRAWKQLIEDLADEDGRTVRATIKTKFDALSWVAHSEEGKFWRSKKPDTKDKHVMLPRTHCGPAPLILMKDAIVWHEVAGDSN